MTFNVTAEVKL